MNGQRKNGTGMRQSVVINNQNQIQLQNAYNDAGMMGAKVGKVNKRTSSMKDSNNSHQQPSGDI